MSLENRKTFKSNAFNFWIKLPINLNQQQRIKGTQWKVYHMSLDLQGGKSVVQGEGKSRCFHPDARYMRHSIIAR